MADNKKVPAKKKTAGDETQLLPLITKFFKFAGVAFSIWLLGYTRCSPSWLLLGLAVFIWKEKHTQRKHLQIRIQQQLAKDEQATILARVEDLPSWVHFPDVERAEWLNKFLDQIWPFIGDYVTKLLMESIQEKIQQSHSSVASFKFTQIDLGDIPPRIGGVKVYTQNVRRDEIYMDLDIIYSSDSFIEVKVKGLTAGIKDLQLRGNLRVIFKPLIGRIPLFGGISVFFINNPDINFNLTGVANSLDLPGLSDMLDTIIAEQIANFMVLPNRIVVPMVENVNLMMLKYPPPDGVLRIHVLEAKDLIRADIGVMKKGKSDPYTVVRVGAQKFKTKVINNTVEPKWNAVFETIIDLKDGQYIEVDLKDEDPGSKDDDLGSVSMDIVHVGNEGTVDSWLPLADVKHGMVHMKLVWMYLSKDLAALDQQMDKDKANSQELSSSLLMVNLDSARELPRSKKQMAEPNPYVVMNVGQSSFESTVKMSTDSPRWEENFRFLVHDPKFQNFELEVMDKKSDKPLGTLSVPIKSVLTATDMTLDQYFNLKQSGVTSQINMRLTLRVLTADKSQAVKESEQIISGSTTTKEGTPVDPEKPVDTEQSSSKQETKKVDTVKPAATDSAKKDTKDTTKGKDAKLTSSVIPPAKPSNLASPTGGTDSDVRQRKSTSPAPSSPTADPKGQFKHGRIEITLRYVEQRKVLVVVIHKCMNLIPCDDDNLADPYIKMYMLPEKSKKHKTQISKNNLNPSFDESFEFQVPPSDVKNKSLELTIRNDTSALSFNKKTMGTLEIDLANLDTTTSTTQWFDVRPEDYEGKPATLSSDV